ncbi:MAG TPA: hypothetical protein VFT13_07885 [Candidatus Krumholzibacteria bacterium]|nr:hypothetical protein [Candidatus Krumholzibacteria bacterium]
MRFGHAVRIAILAVGVAADWHEASAGAGLGGRFWLTYQKTGEVQSQEEYFIQHYEAILRDRLFEQNDLRLTFYFDNSKNLTDDITHRRYRGHLDVIHRYYNFNARYTPRQQVSPLQLEPELEAFQNQLSLDIHVPKAPRLRLSYDTRSQYLDAARTVDVRDLRADLQYQYRVLELRANRWTSTSRNGNELQTDVTGASARATRTFSPLLTASGGYEFRLTESDRQIGPLSTVTNHTITGLLSGRYRDLMTAVLSGSTRRLSQEYIVDTDARDDNVNFILSFLPAGHVRPEASRTYIMTDQNGRRTTTDYASLQVLVDGNVQKRTWGRAQVTRRVDIDTQGGVLPSHVYMMSVRSNLYRGVDLRGELTANETVNDTPALDRFQTSSLFDLYLAPWRSTTVTPHVQFTRFSDELSFVHNDQATSGITVNYIPRYPRMSIGLDVNRTRITTGFRRTDTAGAVNVSLFMRSRSTFNVSYGIRETERYDSGGGSSPGISRANTLNAQAQVWVARRGSISINYTGVDRNPEIDTSQLAVTYRQDF